jgi:hypothetical protein
MKSLEKRFGRLITFSFIVMAIGIMVFLLVFPLYKYFGIDTDIIGLIIFTTGMAICVIGIIRRNNPHGWKLGVLEGLAGVLCLPLLFLIISGIYFVVTGNPF